MDTSIRFFSGAFVALIEFLGATFGARTKQTALTFCEVRAGAEGASNQRLLGKLNIAPSRTPADGQRWVMVLRLV
jgi:hypothetical protein